MRRRNVRYPSPTARDWEPPTSLGFLVKGTFPRILNLPDFVRYVVEGYPPPVTGRGDEERGRNELTRLRRKLDEEKKRDGSDPHL